MLWLLSRACWLPILWHSGLHWVFLQSVIITISLLLSLSRPHSLTHSLALALYRSRYLPLLRWTDTVYGRIDRPPCLSYPVWWPSSLIAGQRGWSREGEEAFMCWRSMLVRLPLIATLTAQDSTAQEQEQEQDSTTGRT